MYYPILRGRQNELLAIKELLKYSKLSKKIIPVLEPVKLSSTLVTTVEAFFDAKHPIVIIRNPEVGTFSSDEKNSKNAQYKEHLNTLLKNESSVIKRGLYVGKDTPDQIIEYKEAGVPAEDVVALCLSPDNIRFFETAFSDYHVKIMLPYAPAFRRIQGDKILTDDKFNKKDRNSEYQDMDDEFFSDDHLALSGYVGFSDYSIIGREYTESGFAPRAVAIHIVYFDKENVLRVHHFVSEDNDDISDPAGKFYQALEKLHIWNQTQKLDTIAMEEFEKIYAEQSYPGLGVIKKLSIMHHLELMSNYLDEATL